jgi:hypothetical protein
MKKCDGTELDHAIAREHFPSWLMALNAYFEKVTEPGTSHADSLYLKDSFQRMNYRNPCLLDVAGLLSACRDERLFNRLITMWHRGYDEPFLVCELINSILDHVRGGTYAVRVGSAGTYGTSLGIEICGLPCLYMGREACAKGLSSLFVVFNYRGDSLELGSIYQLSPGRSRLFESYCRILDLSSSLHHFHIVDPIGLGSVVMRFSTKA